MKSQVCPRCKLLDAPRVITTIYGNIIICPHCNLVIEVTKKFVPSLSRQEE